MTLHERIEADYVAEAKARNASAVSVLRMLRAALKNARIDSGKDLDDAATTDTIAKEVKKLRDAIAMYRDGGRTDLAEQAEAEAALMERYLPKQLGDEELDAIAKEVIAGMPGVTPKDFGKVMGAVMQRAKGQADGGRVSAAVKKALGG
jgi:uncharacterized protein